jgi:hypothetical protein
MGAFKLISVIGLYLAACEGLEYSIVRRYASRIYPPKFGWRLTRWAAMASGITIIAESLYAHKSQPNDAPLWVGLFFLLLGAVWPRTVLVGSDGVSSCSTFGTQHHLIRWSEVSYIDSDSHQVRLPLTSRLIGAHIYVLGCTGTRITHGIVQRGKGQFLDDLRKHLPRDSFAPGLYDWHPAAASIWDWSLRGLRRI